MLVSGCLLAVPVSSQASDDSSAKLTEAHGSVYKRSFVDWSKEEWANPQPAQKGDVLQEGMQIGTGDKSWAQLKWNYITARAWANSVYAIAPNQKIVYLLGGEMLYNLNKNRKDQGDYYVWTKLLQARIHGTTVLFQHSKGCSRLAVLEGTAIVMNRSDHSVVRMSPGCVYEVLDKQNQPSAQNISTSSAVSNGSSGTAVSTKEVANLADNAPHAVNKLGGTVETTANLVDSTLGAGSELGGTVGGVASNASSALLGLGSALSTEIKLLGSTLSSVESLLGVSTQKIQAIRLFETKSTLTSLYVVDPQSVLSHPLLKSFEEPIGSESLITRAFDDLSPQLNIAMSGNADGLKGTIAAGAEIVSVPRKMSYNVGALVGSAISVPPNALSFFPPHGVIPQPEWANGGFGKLPTALGNALGGTSGIPGVNVVPAGSLNNSVGGALSGVGGLTSGSLGAAGGITGGVSGISGGVSGVSNGISGLTGGVSGLTGGLSSGLTGGVSGLTSGLSGGLTKTTTGVSGLTGGLGAVTGGLTNTVQSTLGGVTGLLGH